MDIINRNKNSAVAKGQKHSGQQFTTGKITKASNFMAAAVLSPATTLRLNPFYATVRFLSFRRKTLPKTLLPSLLQPTLITHPSPQNYTHYYVNPSFSGGRKFSSVIAAAILPEKAVEKQKGEVLGSDNEVKKFRKRLRIVDIKGGVDEGLDRLGENLVVKGWIRTLRVQSSVTFIEVFVF